MRKISWLAGIAAFAALGLVPWPGQAEAKRSDPRADVVELGRRLFMDPTVSRFGRFSCGSCHDPEHGFDDPRTLSVDETGPSKRHSQTLLDLHDGSGMHWDGEFDTVRELIQARLSPPQEALELTRNLVNRRYETARRRGEKPNESEYRKKLQSLTPPYYGQRTPTTPGTPIPGPLLQRIAEDGRYKPGFRRAFGSEKVTIERMVDAIEAYVLTLKSGEAPFDKYVAGDPTALDERARRGFHLFTGKANCAKCHSLSGDRPTFTDTSYRNTGIAFKKMAMSFDRGFAGDGGRGEMNFVGNDLGKFKVPGLRNIAARAPYMHDGSLATLEEVVRYYDIGATPNLHLDPEIGKLGLEEREVGDLVAFLESLTSVERPGIGPEPRHRPRVARIQIVDMHGRGIDGLEVEVHPFGDRLAGARGEDRRPRTRVTSRTGWIEFEYPQYTHVQLKAEAYEIDFDRPIPDYVSRLEVVAAPRDQVLLRITAPPGAGSMPKMITAHTATNAVRSRRAPKKTVAVFTRVRSVKHNTALYVAKARPEIGRVNVNLDYRPKNSVGALRSLDLSGGATEPIDLRP